MKMASVYLLALGQVAGTAPGPPRMILENSKIVCFHLIMKQDKGQIVRIHNTAVCFIFLTVTPKNPIKCDEILLLSCFMFLTCFQIFDIF